MNRAPIVKEPAARASVLLTKISMEEGQVTEEEETNRGRKEDAEQRTQQTVHSNKNGGLQILIMQPSLELNSAQHVAGPSITTSPPGPTAHGSILPGPGPEPHSKSLSSSSSSSSSLSFKSSAPTNATASMTPAMVNSIFNVSAMDLPLSSDPVDTMVISWPTVMQEFRRAICNAVLTCLPSFSARLLSTATRPKGMAKEPTSGSTENIMHSSASVPLCWTKNAARMLTTAPTRMHGAYASLGGTTFLTMMKMIRSEVTACTKDFPKPALANICWLSSHLPAASFVAFFLKSPSYTDTPNHCPPNEFHTVSPLHTRQCTNAK